MDALKSIYVWAAVLVLILLWLPMMAVRRLFDRDPAHYYTGRLFRKLGKAVSRVNPNWNINISGNTAIDDRRPYVMVCNHLSQADIPLISNLPWEMKWVAKKPLFSVPLVGWMMQMAGDISVDREAADRREATFGQARDYLSHSCSVMFFPEGTRSRTGTLNRFTTGAFDLAIAQNVPILPMVIDGTQNCLPKKSWKFGHAPNIRLKVLPPVETASLGRNDIEELTNKVRSQICDQLASWRNESSAAVDALVQD